MSNNQDEHNRSGFFVFIFSVVVCIAFFIYISFIQKGIDLKEVPVSAVADNKSADAGADAAAMAKPWLESEAVLMHGKKVYKNNCAICHGDTGMGDGPAGKALVPPARNFVEGKWKNGGTSIDLYKTLQTGIPGGSMASFKHLPKNDRWAMVQFIRSITKNKTADNAAKLEEFAATAD
jgi:mono/diheme cytochrome c family protein